MMQKLPIGVLLLVPMATFCRTDFGIGLVQRPEEVVYGRLGETVNFTCATNVTADRITWNLNFQPLSALTNDFAVSALMDDKISRLSVTLQDRNKTGNSPYGIYQCIAWFGAIALASIPSLLVESVLPDCRLSVRGGSGDAFHVEVGSGCPIILDCNCTTSVAPSAVSFYRNGEYLNGSVDSNILVLQKKLLLPFADRADSGTYSCRSHSPYFTVHETASEEVFIGVTEKKCPNSVSNVSGVYLVAKGDDVKVWCPADGYTGSSAKHWIGPDGRIISHDATRDARLLLIEDVKPANGGTYICRTTALGKDYVVATVVIVVEEAPVVVSKPRSHSVQENEGDFTKCQVRSNPPSRIVWYINGSPVFSDGNILITENTLIIRNVSKEYAGIYQCFAMNKYGASGATAIVTVFPRTVFLINSSGFADNGWSRSKSRRLYPFGPTSVSMKDFPHSRSKAEPHSKETSIKLGALHSNSSRPKVTKVSDESVIVTWDDVSNSRDIMPVWFYKVQYKCLHGKDRSGHKWMTADADIPPDVNSFEVTGLKTGYSYRFRIASVYADNMSKFGRTSRIFLMKQDKRLKRPAGELIIVNASKVGNASLKLIWNYKGQINVPVDGFIINYREVTSAADYKKITLLGPSHRHYVFPYLSPDASYIFKIQAFNLAGASKFSPAFTAYKISNNKNESDKSPFLLKRVPSFENSIYAASNVRCLYLILGVLLSLLLCTILISYTFHYFKSRELEGSTSEKLDYFPVPPVINRPPKSPVLIGLIVDEEKNANMSPESTVL